MKRIFLTAQYYTTDFAIQPQSINPSLNILLVLYILTSNNE